MTTPGAADPSPTTSVRSMLLVLACSAALALLLGAQGLIHAAHGMHDGTERNVALSVGTSALKLSQTVRADGLWNRAQTTLGRPQDVETPPLLAQASTDQPASGITQSSLVRISASSSEMIRAAGPTTRVAPKRHPRTFQRIPTRANPLRLLITGDSLPGYIGPDILSALGSTGHVRGWTDVHDGTGLTRPDYVDWSVVARQQVAAHAPEVTIVLMGGNDFQNMVLANGRVLTAGTPAWTQEYARRVAVCMRIWVRGQGGHRVYWLSMPPARDAGWALDFAQINRAIRQAAATIPGAEYLNILGPVTDHGKYVDYAKVAGQWTLIREDDGVHLNIEGSQIVADEVAPVIKRDWHL